MSAQMTSFSLTVILYSCRIFKRNENIHPHKNIYRKAHGSSIILAEVVDAAQMSVDGRMDKQAAVYLYN